MNNRLSLLAIDWPRPANIGVAITLAGLNITTNGYDNANLALHVGDNANKVNANRQQLAKQLAVKDWQWLEQIHGTTVVEAQVNTPHPPQADACFTRHKNLACAVLTADCLPVLFCNAAGTQVAIAHAGWRGLADGVLANTLSHFDPKESIYAYLGPAISAKYFEVGNEVKAIFMNGFATYATESAISECFTSSTTKPNHYFANLYLLARLQLNALGVSKVAGGEECTFSDSRFYSYRRQAITGRMASAIWIKDPETAQ